MPIGKIFDVALAIVSVAMAWVIATSPNTASIIKASGDAFTGSLRAATGQG